MSLSTIGLSTHAYRLIVRYSIVHKDCHTSTRPVPGRSVGPQNRRWPLHKCRSRAPRAVAFILLGLAHVGDRRGGSATCQPWEFKHRNGLWRRHVGRPTLASVGTRQYLRENGSLGSSSTATAFGDAAWGDLR